MPVILIPAFRSDCDEDAELVTEDELGLGCVLRVGCGFFSISGVPAVNRKYKIRPTYDVRYFGCVLLLLLLLLHNLYNAQIQASSSQLVMSCVI